MATFPLHNVYSSTEVDLKLFKMNFIAGIDRTDGMFLWFFVQIGICIISLIYYRQKYLRITRVENLISIGLLPRLQNDHTLLSRKYLDIALHPKFQMNLARFKMRCRSFSKLCISSMLISIINAIVSFFSNGDSPFSNGLSTFTGISIVINILTFLLVFFSFSKEKGTIKRLDKAIKPEMLSQSRKGPQIPPLPVTYSQPLYANHPQYAKDFQPPQPAYVQPIVPQAAFVLGSAPINYYAQSPTQPKIQYQQQEDVTSPFYMQPSAPYIPQERYSVAQEEKPKNQQYRKSVVRFDLPEDHHDTQDQVFDPFLPPDAYTVLPAQQVRKSVVNAEIRKSALSPALRKSVVPEIRKSIVTPEIRKSTADRPVRKSVTGPDTKLQPPNPFKHQKHQKSHSNAGLDPHNDSIAPRVGAFKFQAKEMIERGVYIPDKNYLNG
jgi:hypothetical protein